MSNEISIGSVYYIPFWILLEFLDATPPDPFIKVRVSNTFKMSATNSKGSVDCCDLIIKPGLIANGIPTEFLIDQKDLPFWANKISEWFLNYTSNQSIVKNEN